MGNTTTNVALHQTKRVAAYRQPERDRLGGKKKKIKTKQKAVQPSGSGHCLFGLSQWTIHGREGERREKNNEKGKMPPGRSCEAKRTEPRERARVKVGETERRTTWETRKEQTRDPFPRPATDPFRPKKKRKTVVAVDGATSLLRTSRFFVAFFAAFAPSLARSLAPSPTLFQV